MKNFTKFDFYLVMGSMFVIMFGSLFLEKIF